MLASSNQFLTQLFFSVQVHREVLIVNELHYCDALKSNNMGVKNNLHAFFWIANLILDVDLEYVQDHQNPLETFTITKDGHAPNF
jgi:hypothetical protein